MVRQKQKAESSGIETEISPEQRKCLETAFEAADKNGDGVLSVDEYYDIFQAHGLTIDREWIERTIAQNDKDGDGGISLDEFIEMNKIKLNKQRSDHERKTQSDIVHEKARLAFNAYDRNRDGYLTKAEMKKTSKMMTEAQIDAVFDKYDKNKDGKLSFEEFKHLMESHNKEKRSQASHHQPPETSQSASASTTTSEVTLTNE